MTHLRNLQVLSFVSLAAFAISGHGQQNPGMKPEETEVWKPVPAVVTPGSTDAAPPSDAIVLFDGKNLDEWVNAQTGAPASATPSKSEPTQTQAQASAHKDKTDVHTGAHKSAAKGTTHKAKTTPDTAKPEAAKPAAAKPEAAKPAAAKASTVDNTKKQ